MEFDLVTLVLEDLASRLIDVLEQQDLDVLCRKGFQLPLGDGLVREVAVACGKRGGRARAKRVEGCRW